MIPVILIAYWLFAGVTVFFAVDDNKDVALTLIIALSFGGIILPVKLIIEAGS